METWKKIKGWEHYEVSDLGNIRNSKKEILKPFDNGNGYLIIRLSKNGKQTKHRVSRIVAQTFIYNKENKNQVNHIDGNKKNNCVSNLEWSTSRENIEHAYNSGLTKNNTKLRVYDVVSGTTKDFRSMRQCSFYFNRSKNYISELLQRGENCVDGRFYIFKLGD